MNSTSTNNSFSRMIIMAYCAIAYVLFLGVFLYLIGFVTNQVVPISVDHARNGSSYIMAILINFGLIALFGVQHSVMARPAFKKWLTGFVPPAAERATYVLATVIMFVILFTQWRELPQPLLTIHMPIAWAVWAVCAFGWLLVLAATFMIDHFDLFGLRQGWLNYRGVDYTAPVFQERWAYKHIRHPIMTGFLIGMWAHPNMTVGHLVLAGGFTAYILVGVYYEEKDMHASVPSYQDYEKRVPGFIPTGRKK